MRSAETRRGQRQPRGSARSTGEPVELPEAFGTDAPRQTRPRQAQQFAQRGHAHAGQALQFIFGPVQMPQRQRRQPPRQPRRRC